MMTSMMKKFRLPFKGTTLFLVLWLGSSCAYCVDNTLHPKAEEHNAFCAQYLAQGKLTEAEARCKLAIEFAPKYAEPYHNLGMIEHQRGRIELAVDRYKQALSLKDDFAEVYNNLGSIFLERQEYAAACDQFLQAIEIDPGYVDARANLALCYYRERKPVLARDQYLRCVEQDPELCDCRQGLAVLEYEGGDYEGAKANFQALTNICPDYAQGYYNLGTTYLKLGRCQDGFDEFATCLRIDDQHLECQQNIQRAYQCLNLKDAAITKAMADMSSNPGDPELHFKLARLFDQKKDKEQALRYYQSTIQLNPQYSEAYLRAAKIMDAFLRAKDVVNLCRHFVALTTATDFPDERGWCIQRVRDLQFN